MAFSDLDLDKMRVERSSPLLSSLTLQEQKKNFPPGLGRHKQVDGRVIAWGWGDARKSWGHSRALRARAPHRNVVGDSF